MITFVLKVVPPCRELPEDVILHPNDVFKVNLKFTGAVDMSTTYTYVAHELVTIKLEHFDIIYPDNYTGAHVEFTKSSP